MTDHERNKKITQSAIDYISSQLTSEHLTVEDIKHAFMSGAFEMGQLINNSTLWKAGDGPELPDIDREVIVLTKDNKVAFAHRPPEYWDGKDIHTGKVRRCYLQRYGIGQWNIPDIAFWLNYHLPSEENHQPEKEIGVKGLLSYVDLGLPSGTLWAKCNLGAEKETDFGLFYQWGDTQGYDDDTKHSFSWNACKWGAWNKLTKYNKTDGKRVLDNEDDPVYTATGGEMVSPSKNQLQELIDHTKHEWTEIDGINGMKFINKDDDSKYIFIPAAGYCYDSYRNLVDSWGYMWSSSRNSGYPFGAWAMHFNSRNVDMGDYSRCYGYNVRGVATPQTETFDEIDDTDDGQPVDLGLPSGTLWMKSNLGGSKPSDFGNFYQWADIQGYDGDAGHEFSWDTYKYGTSWNNMTKYDNIDGKTTLGNEDDPVYVPSGGQYKSPTKEQLQELMNNTDHQWVRLANGVNGMKFVNRSDDTKYIFIPAAGCCYDLYHNGVGSWGYVWSSSRRPSNPGNAWYMYFNSGVVNVYNGSRCNGFNVRGVMAPEKKEEEPIQRLRCAWRKFDLS